MLRSSKIYIYDRDRVLVAVEHFHQVGWGRDVVLDAGICEDVTEARRAECDGRKPKRRRGRAADFTVKGKALIGNAECLPDLSSVLIPLVMVMNCGLWERDLVLAGLPLIEVVASADLAKSLICTHLRREGS